MDIIEPVTLGDVAFTRPSPKWVFDRTGTLVQVPAGSFAVTYDPNDLTKAPYALVEPAATKCLASNDALTTWPIYTTGSGSVSVESIVDPQFGTVFRITKTGGYPGDRAGIRTSAVAGLSGSAFSVSCFVRRGTSMTTGYAPYVDANTDDVLLSCSIPFNGVQPVGEWVYLENTVSAASNPRSMTGTGSAYIWVDSNVGDYVDVKLPEVEVGSVMSSPAILGAGQAPYTRPADTVATGAGLVHSNVPITEPNYNSATTYAKDAVVHDPTTHNTYVSLIAGNVGKALTDTTAWSPNGVTNRWAMLDQYNNTQTTNAEEIIHVLSPQTISQGFYVGNVDASEVRVSVVDLYKGLVYQETQSLRVSNSESSYFNWCFRRKRNRTWAVSLKLRPYANALVTITLKKPGGVAKCGMCVVGPTMDLGRTLMTLGAEIKDFSDTSFNFDGTSKTTIRNWAKRISADVIVDASRVDDVYEFMASYRQRPLVWVGSPNYGLAIAFGRYSGIKPVVKGATRWDMSMQIEGTV